MLLTCSPYGDFPIQDSVFLFLLSWNSNPCPAQLNVQVCVPRRALSEGARIPHLAQWPSSAATDPRNLKMVAQLLWGRLSYLESRMKMIKPYLPTSQGYFEKQIKLWILKVLKWLGERGTFSVVCVCVCVLVTQSCLTLCDPMDCNPPGSSVCGILQARILEWAASPFSRRSSQPRDWTQVSYIVGRFLLSESPGKTCLVYIYFNSCLWFRLSLNIANDWNVFRCF